MPIREKTNREERNGHVDGSVSALMKATVNAFNQCGEQCVNVARDRNKAGKQYLDQTGNHTSSYQSSLAMGGKLEGISNYPAVKKGTEGAKMGRELAEELAKGSRHAIDMFIVAGMPYSLYLHHMGYDITDSAQLELSQILPRRLKSLGWKIK